MSKDFRSLTRLFDLSFDILRLGLSDFNGKNNNANRSIQWSIREAEMELAEVAERDLSAALKLLI